MKMDYLKGISAKGKREFLARLQSGQYTLLQPYPRMPKRTFELQASGLYKCEKTGELMTLSEIRRLKGYRLSIHLISNRAQVEGNEPPDSVILCPYNESEFLESLLMSNDTEQAKNVTQ